ncbi:DUF5132 domain-containing protein [Streptomyces sp. NPDC055189]
MAPVLLPFLAGMVMTSAAKHVAKPILHGTVKTSMKIVADAKRAAHRANEEFHDIAAEAAAEMFVEEATDTMAAKRGKAAAK